MRKARVISYTKPKRPRRRYSLRLFPFIVLFLLRFTLVLSPFVIGGYYIYHHGSPHILWEYEYFGSKERPHITSCTYIGIYGARTFPAHECPFVNFIQ